MRGETEDGVALVLMEWHGSVLQLTLNRPHRLNAVSFELYGELIAAVRSAADDAQLRAIVLTGAGRAFCAGADLKAHAESDRTRKQRQRYARAAQRACLALQRSPLPVIAAVNGPAIGAGLELALSCDLVVVAQDARLRLPELALGTFVGGALTQILPERVGMTRAKELLLLGDFFTGDQAFAWNLVNYAVPAGHVMNTAFDLAERMAANAPLSLRFAKRLLRRARRMSRRAVMAAEVNALQRCMESQDWKEGVLAFQEKRAPQYQGR
jgi:enoyl-CoA hydratase